MADTMTSQNIDLSS